MTSTIYGGADPTGIEGYTQSQLGDATYSVAIQVSKTGTLKRIGYWSGSGATTILPIKVGLFEVGNTTPILEVTATWSGAHDTGWIWAPVTDTSLDHTKIYYAVIGVDAPIDMAFVYPGEAVVPTASTDGFISVPATVTDPAGPASPYQNGDSFTYPATAVPGAFSWLIDVEIDFPDDTPVFTVTEGATSDGVTTYSVDATINSTDDSGPQDMRVLQPSSPAAGRPHAFLWMLPVEPGPGSTFGDPIDVARILGIHNTYNLTCVEPEFPLDPWYADHATDPKTKQETYILALVDWVKANIAPDGTEKHYLIGFSKSGFGGQVLFLRHQDVFEAVASWDAATDYQTLAQYDGEDVFGTQDQLDAYELYNPNLSSWKSDGDTGTVNRIWLGAGINLIDATSDYSDRLTADSIQHTYVFVEADAHSWAPTPGWVGPAVLAMLGAPPQDAIMGFTII